MTRISQLLFVAILFGLAAFAASNAPIVGKWDVTATDEGGNVTAWTLAVKEDGGKLSGTLTGTESSLRTPDLAWIFRVVE
jgi:hypothetical protein